MTERGFIAACATCNKPISVEFAPSAAELTLPPNALRSGKTGGVHAAKKDGTAGSANEFAGGTGSVGFVDGTGSVGGALSTEETSEGTDSRALHRRERRPDEGG